jgi:hypothetical protein
MRVIHSTLVVERSLISHPHNRLTKLEQTQKCKNYLNFVSTFHLSSNPPLQRKDGFY